MTHFSWGDGDVVVFTRSNLPGNTLLRVSAGGGAPVLVAQADTSKLKGTSFGWPFVLPGGKAVLFDIVTSNDQPGGELAALRLADGKVTRLGVIGRNPRYVATGHIVFGRLDGTVVAVPFDASALRVTGPPVTVLQGVLVRSGGASEFGVAQDGTMFFVEGTALVELVLVDRTGATRPLLSEPRDYSRARFAPTGGRVAFQMADRSSFSKSDIWVYNDRTTTITRLTNDGTSNTPFWMGDGERVVWMSNDSSGNHVRRQRWDGTGSPETLFAGESKITSVVPSPAGKGFAVVKQGGFSDLYYAEGDPPSALRPLVVTPTGEGGPSFSPAGRWIAYYGDETGRTEVYVIAATGDGGRHQISTDGGGEPVWAPDGKTLYYRAGGYMVAAAITTAPAFTVTKREPLFPDRFRSTGNVAAYDVSRDGKSFLMSGQSGRANERIVVVTGWLDELKERMALAGKK